MRMSQLFSQTIRENPSESDVTSHQLLLRAGFIRQVGVGIFSFLPLARRSLTKIENIIRQEINAINGQEISMPFVQPADLWKESGRWYKIGSEMGRFMDKNNHEMVLSMTHGEVIAYLVRREVRSYRQLPQLLYHIQTQWYDNPHPHAGLLKSREFTMIEGYSLDADREGLDIQYEAHQRAFQNIFLRCNLPVIISKSDTGIMGGKLAHEYVYPSQVGENEIIICEYCGYSANIKIAKAKKVPLIDESQLIIEKVSTPNCKTIEELAKYLSIPTNKTAKALLVIATIVEGNKNHERFVIAIVRGDMFINEAKLANELNATEIRPAIESEILAVGSVPGYASPIGLNDAFIIVDELIPMSSNLVSGANIEGYHLLNVNYSRDYKADIIADITRTNDGDLCAVCNNPLHTVHAVEVGKIFKLGTQFSKSMDSNYLDRQGKNNPIIMGSYGIDVGRLMACIAEEHHDEHGLIWPITVSPYTIHLVSLPLRTNSPSDIGPIMAENLYLKLKEEQIECLFDDREESPGIKFNDADLIGNPIRLTISERSINNGGIEFKRRDSPEKNIISYENIIPRIHEELDRLHPK